MVDTTRRRSMRLLIVSILISASGCSGALNSDPVAESEPIQDGVTLMVPAVSSSKIDFTWTTALTNVSQYVVKRGAASNSLTTIWTTSSSPPLTSYSDGAVSAGKTYYYRVIA